VWVDCLDCFGRKDFYANFQVLHALLMPRTRVIRDPGGSYREYGLGVRQTPAPRREQSPGLDLRSISMAITAGRFKSKASPTQLRSASPFVMVSKALRHF